jgi:hypothetical protein
MLFKHLKIAINIISVTADWLSDAKGIILVPISFLIIGITIFIAWVLAMISIGSMSATPIEHDFDSVYSQAKYWEWAAGTELMLIL